MTITSIAKAHWGVLSIIRRLGDHCLLLQVYDFISNRDNSGLATALHLAIFNDIAPSSYKGSRQEREKKNKNQANFLKRHILKNLGFDSSTLQPNIGLVASFPRQLSLSLRQCYSSTLQQKEIAKELHVDILPFRPRVFTTSAACSVVLLSVLNRALSAQLPCYGLAHR